MKKINTEKERGIESIHEKVKLKPKQNHVWFGS